MANTEGDASREPAESGTVEGGPPLVAADLIEDRELRETDPDTLDHGPIADRVADLVAVSDKPLNVALFGAWGSGKSSFANLLKHSLAKRDGAPRVVRYNAWTFEGESFQRNFISSVASDLEMREGDRRDYIQFHSGLYETRRAGRLEISRDDVVTVLMLALGLGLVLLSLLFILVALLSRLFGSTDPVKVAVDALPGLIPTTAVAGLLAAVAKELIAGARVNIDTSAPTQEQFRAKFELLLELAKDDKDLDSFVFFIDELDRCAPEQVVTVLAAVRHFYDLPNCVFVVAADRDAIVQALKRKSEHATPLNTETPYFSAAGEFIDKIFQHQLNLPPLRGRRLTRFARDLVTKKTSGIWAELGAVDGGRLLDQLVYVLIPSHVASPRRVKVLLNNFATNARIAQARGIDVVAQALEVAKLVALRTEFPLLAADLTAEPRLPTLLLALPAEQTPRLKVLLERHKLPSATEDDPSGLSETDVTLAKADDAGRDRLRFAERSLLRRYLVRTSEFPDPSLDLLYLEPAGAAVDLADRELGLLLEQASPERPSEVIDAAKAQSADERRKALRVLADMVSSGDEFGPERANVVTAMLGISATMDYDVGTFDREVLGALRLYRQEEGLMPAHLPLALATALKADDRALSAAVLSDDRLLIDATATRDVALIADLIPKEQRPRVWEKVAEFYPSDPKILNPLVEGLSQVVAAELLQHNPLSAAIRARLNGLDVEEAVEEVATLLASIDARSGDSDAVRGALLLRLPDDGSNGYVALRRHEAELAKITVRPDWKNVIALKAIRLGPPEDWDTWHPYLGPVPHPWKDEVARVNLTAKAILARWSDAEATGYGPNAAATLAKVASLIPKPTDGEFAVAIEPASRALTEVAPVGRPTRPVGWWDDDTRADAQSRLHLALLRLDVGPKTHSMLSELVVSDLERTLSVPPSDLALTAIEAAAPLLELTNVQRLAASLKGASPDPGRLATFGRARLATVHAIKVAGGSPHDPAVTVDPSTVVELLATPDRQAVLEEWFDLVPAEAAATTVLRELGPRPRDRELAPVIKWARELSTEARTELLLQMAALGNDTSRWMESLGQEPVDESRVIGSLVLRMQSATRGDERNELARTIAAAPMSDPASVRAIGRLITWMLDPIRKIDRSAVFGLVPALQGRRHGMGKELSQAFESAERAGLAITGKARSELARANIVVKSPSLGATISKRFRNRR